MYWLMSWQRSLFLLPSSRMKNFSTWQATFMGFYFLKTLFLSRENLHMTDHDYKSTSFFLLQPRLNLSYLAKLFVILRKDNSFLFSLCVLNCLKCLWYKMPKKRPRIVQNIVIGRTNFHLSIKESKLNNLWKSFSCYCCNVASI